MWAIKFKHRHNKNKPFIGNTSTNKLRYFRALRHLLINTYHKTQVYFATQPLKVLSNRVPPAVSLRNPAFCPHMILVFCMTDTTDKGYTIRWNKLSRCPTTYTASDPIGVPTTSTAEWRLCQTKSLIVKCFERRGRGVVYNPSLVWPDYEKHYKHITRSPSRDVNPGRPE